MVAPNLFSNINTDAVVLGATVVALMLLQIILSIKITKNKVPLTMKTLDSHYKRFLNNQKKKRDDDTTLSSKIHRFSVVTIQRDTKSDQQ